MDRLKQIFLRQTELTNQFLRIERDNGLGDYHHIPFDVTNTYAQKQLRATAWYMVEEIGEVLTAPLETQQEEVIDVLHFLVELLICSGITPEQIYPASKDKLSDLFLNHSHIYENSCEYLIETLAIAVHHLKAKPWKANPKETLVTIYQNDLVQVLFAFIEFAGFYGLTPDSLYNIYMGKANVNQKRIEGNV